MTTITTAEGALRVSLFEAFAYKLWMDALGGKISQQRMLTGMIFDAEGRPLGPAFSYGRGGRAYRYYVSAPLQKGASVHVDDTLRRVPGRAADELIVDAVSRLARAETNPACLSQHLRRVELHANCIHLVPKRPGLAGQTRDARTDIAAIERRLAPGERLLD